jgi:hypothetical protein|tara:strand:+ start:288 stop:518 length:231 start_codon:yes stop_codon:yes gene_type:complete
MDQQQPQMNLDLSKTTAIDTPSGGKIWQQGMIVRKVSKFVVGAQEDAIVPIPVFFDPETGKILEDTLPKELREEYA